MLCCPELLLSSLLVLKWSLMLPIDLGTWNFSCSERNAKENTPRTKVDMKLINGSWFSLFSNFEEETGLEHFYFVGKLSVRLHLRALDDCSQLKIQLRIGKVICGFPGRTWSKLAKLADVVYKFQRSWESYQKNLPTPKHFRIQTKWPRTMDAINI